MSPIYRVVVYLAPAVHRTIIGHMADDPNLVVHSFGVGQLRQQPGHGAVRISFVQFQPAVLIDSDIKCGNVQISRQSIHCIQ